MTTFLASMTKSVCIIGAGPAGIAAAKTFLHPEGAFKITVYEKTPRIGGLWPLKTTDEGMINPSMSTNLSRYTVCYGDEEWPVKDGKPLYPVFPKANHVGEYLQRNVEKYLDKSRVDIHTSCEVVQIKIQDNAGSKKWYVKVQKQPVTNSKQPSPNAENPSAKENQGAQQAAPADEPLIEEHIFDHVIISSGFFGKPRIPESLGDVKDSNIPIVHSSAFRSIKTLLEGSNAPPGKILVVGGSMSGAETSATVASQLSSEAHSPEKSEIADVEKYSIHHVSSKPFWTLPLMLPANAVLDDEDIGDKTLNPAPSFLPIDFVMFNLANRSPEQRLKSRSGIISPDAAQKTHEAFRAFNAGQKHPHAFRPDDTDTDAAWLAIVDSYSSYVQSGAITPVPGRLTRLGHEPHSVIIETPSASETISGISAIILATGFDASSSLSFLPPALLERLGYDASTPDIPLALSWHSTIHPSLPSLGFVGFYRGPYWGVMQQQAALLRTLWLDSGSSSNALAEALQSAVSPVPELREVLKNNPERITQFPMGDYMHAMEYLRHLQGYEPVSVSGKKGSCVPILPARYVALDLVSQQDAANAIERANQEVLASRKGKFVARAIFRALQGTWKLDRRIDSNISTYPSGTVIGTAKFHPRAPTQDGCDGEYLYVEDGEFKTETGLQFRATRRYVYRYTESTDKLSVWFVKTDNKTVDYLFHELEILSPHPAPSSTGDVEALESSYGRLGVKEQGAEAVVSEKDRRWRARAHHLCIDDTYDPEYEFKFQGVGLERWSVGYHVKGPQKDYWIGSTFTR